MPRSRNFALTATGVLVVGFFSVLAFSQNITGTILGVVKDASGAVVSGAEVAAVNLDTNQSVKTTTNQLGSYELPYLRPGRYPVRVTAARFKNVVRGNIAAGGEPSAP